MRDSKVVELLESIKGDKVSDAYESWPELAKKGYSSSIGKIFKGCKSILFLGMGGSASAGDIISGWLSIEGKIDVHVGKGYIPLSDLSKALIIICSASGSTRETLSMAKRISDKSKKVITISSGGELEELSKNKNFIHINAPKAIAPRYQLPFFIFASIAIIRDQFGIDTDNEVIEAIEGMRKLADEIGIKRDIAHNPSKRLAVRLYRKIPKLYASRITWGIALRFKNMLNENSKKHAMAAMFPEIFHNEIESWEYEKGEFLPLFLRHRREEEELAKRIRKMQSMLENSGIDLIELYGKGEGDLSQIVSLNYILDFASYYIALALKRDPLKTRLIDSMKSFVI